MVVRNISRLRLEAPVARVWEALTAPHLVKLWQYGSDLETTWKVGSPIRFKTVWQDTVFEQWGTVLEFRVNQELRYTLFAPRPGLEDTPENSFTMAYKLTGGSGFVDLEIVQEDGRPGAVQEEEQGEENPVLAQLKAVVEQESVEKGKVMP